MSKAMSASYSTIKSSFAKGEYKPVYLFHGEEQYFVDELTNVVQHEVLNESEKAFNLTVLYGKEANFENVVDNCRQYPMMAEKRVVVIREAQNMKELKSLESYINNPTPSTILVISYQHGKVDGRSTFLKAIKKSGTVFEAKSLYDNELPRWIRQLLIEKGYSIDDDALMLMSENIGNDLSKVAREIEKLSINLKENTRINKEMILRYVGISKQYNVYELQKAMGSGDFKKSMKIAVYLSQNTHENHPIFILASLYNYYSKLLLTGIHKRKTDKELQRILTLPSPYFVKDYKGSIQFFNARKLLKGFELLAEYDLRFKGVNNRSTPIGELLKELIFKLMTA